VNYVPRQQAGRVSCIHCYCGDDYPIRTADSGNGASQIGREVQRKDAEPGNQVLFWRYQIAEAICIIPALDHRNP
jgi:hypothetical protein